MKQAYKAIGWFFLIYVAGLLVAIGYLAIKYDLANASFAEGQEIGRAFRESYGTLWLLSSLLISVIGTALEKLPGTKKKA